MFSRVDRPINRRNTQVVQSRNSLLPTGSRDNRLPGIKRSSSLEDLRKANTTDSGLDETETKKELHSAYFRRYELMIEFANLRNPSVCPSGVYVMPALDNINLWYGVLFIHKGYYRDAVLKFRLDIPESYPTLPPNVTFITDTFHPLVDQNGRFAIEAKFPDWSAHREHIVDILRFVKSSFKVEVLDSLNEEVCLNKPAYRMYNKEKHLFTRLSEQCAKVSYADSVAFDDYPEGNTIRFKPLSDAKFEELYSQMVEPSTDIPTATPSKPVSSLDGVLSTLKRTFSTNINRIFE